MNLAILDDYHGIALQMADWSSVGRRCHIEVFTRKLANEDEAAAALAAFDIVCTLRERTPFPRSLIERLPRLRYIAVTGMRYDTMDVAAATQRGVLVSNSQVPGGGGGVSELAWGLIIATARHIAHEDRMMREGAWQTRIGFTLKGKTIGIVGLGRIGSRMAAYAGAFQMPVIAWSPNLTPDRAAACGAQCVGKDELLRRSDIVTLHVPLAEETRDLIGQRELALMKPGALLVNTARGAIVNRAALIEALQSRHLGGAALDVFDVEPLPADDPLRRLENVVLTPHIGYYTKEMLRVYYADAVEAIDAFLHGRPIRIINPAAAASRRA